MGKENNHSSNTFCPDSSIWLVTEESIISIALMVSLCWLTISTALTSTATPEAMGTEDIHPSQSLDDFHGFSWHHPHSVQN